ncbi:hypothetical protein M408DRAFT_41726, partial [Serendipita vermifera MAFF 305830]
HVQCLQGTREKSLFAISLWFDDESALKRILCLLDSAGSGKSTFAKTLAEEWGKGRFLARFFFSRETAETSGTNSFCSIVADGFASLDPAFRRYADEFREKHRDWARLSFKKQFEGLIATPLMKLKQLVDSQPKQRADSKFKQHPILVIDALDECNKNPEGREELLRNLSSEKLSFHLRIMITGRPE